MVPVDTWVRVPDTAPISHAFPVPFYPNVPGAKASSVLNAWSGGYWDPVRRELGISGGGHADGSINGVWALSVDTWRWRPVIAFRTSSRCSDTWTTCS
jgi:hypothetical protein